MKRLLLVLLFSSMSFAQTRVNASQMRAPSGTASVSQLLSCTPSSTCVWAVPGVVPNAQTGTTYTVLATDRMKYLTFSNGSAIAVTLPQAGSSGFASNYVLVACDIGTGTATITPTTSTISSSNGSAYTAAAASLALTTGQCAWIYSDNTNYFAIVRAAGGTTINATNNVIPKRSSATAFADSALTDDGTTVITTERISFGGTTNSFPMISNNGSQLRIKFADDSGFTSLYAGGITGFTYSTDSNCAAVGSAANPSVASCGAAPAGAFSCATNASTGTCQVNTTAVTANSDIIVQQVSYLNTRLSVTCNTASVLPAGPLTTAISAGSSFTITLGTVVTNPGCFVYWISN